MRYKLALMILLSVSNVATGDVAALEGHKAGINFIDFSADGKQLVSGSSDSTARVWSLETKQEIATLRHDGPVTRVRFLGNDKVVVVFETEQRICQTFGRRKNRTDGNASQLCVWDVDKEKRLYTIESPARDRLGWITDCVVSPDGKWFAVRMFVEGPMGAAELAVFDAVTGKEVMRRSFESNQSDLIWISNLGATPPMIAFSGRGKTIISVESVKSEDRFVAIDCDSGKESYVVASGGWVRKIVVTSDGAVLGAAVVQQVRGGTRNFVRAWDASSGKPLATTKPMYGGVASLGALSKDKFLFGVARYSVTDFTGLAVLDVATSQMLPIFSAETSLKDGNPSGLWVNLVAIDSEALRFAIADIMDEVLHVESLKDRPSLTLEFSRVKLTHCSQFRFSPTGRYLVAACTDHDIRDLAFWSPKLLTVWDLESESESLAPSTDYPHPSTVE
jgi:WD40 repeat protein